MKLKRYSLKELEPKLEELIYEYLATDNKVYFQQEVEAEGKNVPSIILESRTQLSKDIKTRIKDYTERKCKTLNEEERKIYGEAIEVLENELDRVNDISIEGQKRRYAQTGDVFMTHTFVAVPLNKKLNALYDDFNISVCFFDNLMNEQGVKEFSKLKTKQEKIDYVKSHIEITHIVLSLSSSTRAGIIIKGSFDSYYTQVESSKAELLPKMYADFTQVTLADCEKIVNNDLKQLIQERIDMDKEKLDLLSDLDIKGDNYKIYRTPNKDLYIRYVCPSTQRVYYNLIDTNYLADSKYFELGDYDSYIKAWFSINNLFMELDEDSLQLKTIRC